MNGNGNGHIKHRFEPIPFSQIKLDTSQSYLIRDLIPTNGLTVVWGAPKCGKSFFVFDAMMHIALGWPYQGKRTKQGTVLYITCEGQAGFPARKEAFQQKFLEEDTIVPFHLLPTRLDLAHDAEQLIYDIRAYMAGQTVAAIVIDTLNRSLAGSESKDEDMAAYIVACDKLREIFQCAVVVVHHCGVESTRPRGHTSLTGAADAQIGVKKDDTGLVTAHVDFMKDGPDEAEVCFRLEPVIVGTNDDGDEITSCIVAPADGEEPERAPKPKRKGKAATVAFGNLENLLAEGGETADDYHVPNGKTAVRVETWRKTHYLHLGNDVPEATRRQDFYRARTELLANKQIGIHGDWVWIP